MKREHRSAVVPVMRSLEKKRNDATTEPDPITAPTPNWFIVFVATFARSPMDSGVASSDNPTTRFGVLRWKQLSNSGPSLSPSNLVRMRHYGNVPNETVFRITH